MSNTPEAHSQLELWDFATVTPSVCVVAIRAVLELPSLHSTTPSTELSFVWSCTQVILKLKCVTQHGTLCPTRCTAGAISSCFTQGWFCRSPQELTWYPVSRALGRGTCSQIWDVGAVLSHVAGGAAAWLEPRRSSCRWSPS